jgi:hypothetical protein
LKTIGRVIFKNVEVATTIVNSKISWYVLISWFEVWYF